MSIQLPEPSPQTSCSAIGVLASGPYEKYSAVKSIIRRSRSAIDEAVCSRSRKRSVMAGGRPRNCFWHAGKFGVPDPPEPIE